LGQAKLEDAKAIREGKLKPTQIVEADDYYLEKKISCIWKSCST
jgi:hypothetical protein